MSADLDSTRSPHRIIRDAELAARRKFKATQGMNYALVGESPSFDTFFRDEIESALSLQREEIARLTRELSVYRALYEDHGNETLGGLLTRCKRAEEDVARLNAALDEARDAASLHAHVAAVLTAAAFKRDADVMRCRYCKRAIHESRYDEAMVHRHDCPIEGLKQLGFNPWEAIRALSPPERAAEEPNASISHETGE